MEVTVERKKVRRKKTTGTGKVLKKKKRKVKRKRRPSVEAAEQAKQEVSPAERIQLGGRGFKLGFGGLPTQRKLTEQQRALVNNKEAKVAKRMLRQAVALFDKHDAVTAMNSAKGVVLTLFHEKTLPFPDPGVRLFMLETADIDFEKMSEDEINANFARQIERFSNEMQEKIDNYHAAVKKLQGHWADVLKAAEGALEDLYDPGAYPLAEQLPTTLACHFRPVNIELPKEYGFVSPIERQRALAVVEKQFEEAVEKQADFVVKYLHTAIDEMIESVSGYHDGEKKTFRGTKRIENVFKAFKEFKEKTVRYGILSGTALEAEFKRAEQFMREGSHDIDTLPGALKASEGKREDLLEKMTMVRDSVASLAESRKRRRVVRD